MRLKMEERDALLDRFQRNQLEADDRETLERLAADDPAFLRELAFRTSLRNSFDDVQRAERLAQLEADEHWRHRQKMKKWATAGAVFLAAVVVGFWLFGPKKASNQPLLPPPNENENAPTQPVLPKNETEKEPSKNERKTEKEAPKTEVANAEPKLPRWSPNTAFLDTLREKRRIKTANFDPANEWPAIFFNQKGKQKEAALALDELLGTDPEEWKKRPNACFWAAAFDLKRTGPKARTVEFLRIFLNENPGDAVAESLLTEALAYRKDGFEEAKKRFKKASKADRKRLPRAVRRALE